VNIYVGNLSYEITQEDLQQAFEGFGQVESVKVIKDNYSGRSKGFGFVEMRDSAEGQSAIDGLNGKELKGRMLKVDKARPRSEDRGYGGNRRGARQGGRRGSYY
jgi:RNA recognition motif-containing protein